jgi:hypothetical protein
MIIWIAYFDFFFVWLTFGLISSRMVGSIILNVFNTIFYNKKPILFNNFLTDLNFFF